MIPIMLHALTALVGLVALAALVGLVLTDHDLIARRRR